MNDDKSYRREDHSPVCTCFKCEAYDREQDARRPYEPERLNFCSKHQSWLCGCANAPRSLSNLIRKGGFAVLFTGLVIFGAWGAWVLLTTSQQDNIVSTPEPTVTDDAPTPEMPPDDILIPEQMTELTPEPIEAPDDEVIGFSRAIKFAHDAESGNQVEALHRGMSLWTDLNPSIEFEQVTQNSFALELLITFIDLPEHADYIGLWCSDGCTSLNYRGVAAASFISKGHAEILVDTGQLSCAFEWNEYVVNLMANTVAHEIGHHLGLDHHPVKGHLLYGNDRESDNFNDLGYIIPDELHVDDHVAKAAELSARLTDLNERLDEIDSMPNASLITSLVNEYNAIVDEHNEIIDEINCLNNAI